MPTTLSEEKPKIAKFLSSHSIGIIATSSKDAVPHAATIYFTVNHNLDVFFMTKTETTKAINILENPRASLAVYDAQKLTTVQLHGSVRKVEDDARRSEVMKRISEMATTNNPEAQMPIAELPAGKYIVFELKPDSIRMAEYNAPDHQLLENIFDVVVPPEQEL